MRYAPSLCVTRPSPSYLKCGNNAINLRRDINPVLILTPPLSVWYIMAGVPVISNDLMIARLLRSFFLVASLAIDFGSVAVFSLRNALPTTFSKCCNADSGCGACNQAAASPRLLGVNKATGMYLTVNFPELINCTSFSYSTWQYGQLGS